MTPSTTNKFQSRFFLIFSNEHHTFQKMWSANTYLFQLYWLIALGIINSISHQYKNSNKDSQSQIKISKPNYHTLIANTLHFQASMGYHGILSFNFENMFPSVPNSKKCKALPLFKQYFYLFLHNFDCSCCYLQSP